MFGSSWNFGRNNRNQHNNNKPLNVSVDESLDLGAEHSVILSRTELTALGLAPPPLSNKQRVSETTTTTPTSQLSDEENQENEHGSLPGTTTSSAVNQQFWMDCLKEEGAGGEEEQTVASLPSPFAEVSHKQNVFQPREISTAKSQSSTSPQKTSQQHLVSEQRDVAADYEKETSYEDDPSLEDDRTSKPMPHPLQAFVQPRSLDLPPIPEIASSSSDSPTMIYSRFSRSSDLGAAPSFGSNFAALPSNSIVPSESGESSEEHGEDEEAFVEPAPREDAERPEEPPREPEIVPPRRVSAKERSWSAPRSRRTSFEDGPNWNRSSDKIVVGDLSKPSSRHTGPLDLDEHLDELIRVNKARSPAKSFKKHSPATSTLEPSVEVAVPSAQVTQDFHWAYKLWHKRGLMAVVPERTQAPNRVRGGQPGTGTSVEQHLRASSDEPISSLVTPRSNMMQFDFDDESGNVSKPGRLSLPAANLSASKPSSFSNILKKWRRKSDAQPNAQMLSPELASPPRVKANFFRGNGASQFYQGGPMASPRAVTGAAEKGAPPVEQPESVPSNPSDSNGKKDPPGEEPKKASFNSSGGSKAAIAKAAAKMSALPVVDDASDKREPVQERPSQAARMTRFMKPSKGRSKQMDPLSRLQSPGRSAQAHFRRNKSPPQSRGDYKKAALTVLSQVEDKKNESSSSWDPFGVKTNDSQDYIEAETMSVQSFQAESVVSDTSSLRRARVRDYPYRRNPVNDRRPPPVKVRDTPPPMSPATTAEVNLTRGMSSKPDSSLRTNPVRVVDLNDRETTDRLMLELDEETNYSIPSQVELRESRQSLDTVGTDMLATPREFSDSSPWTKKVSNYLAQVGANHISPETSGQPRQERPWQRDRMSRKVNSSVGQGFSKDAVDGCHCSTMSIFSGNDDMVDFYLPLMETACTCGKESSGLVNREEPTALENILRPWQVEFLAAFGIYRGDQLVKAHHRSANALARALRQYRKKQGMSAFRTKSCGMALHIWSKTAKAFVRAIRKQFLEGCGTELKVPNTLYILSSFFEHLTQHQRDEDEEHVEGPVRSYRREAEPQVAFDLASECEL